MSIFFASSSSGMREWEWRRRGSGLPGFNAQTNASDNEWPHCRNKRRGQDRSRTRSAVDAQLHGCNGSKWQMAMAGRPATSTDLSNEHVIVGSFAIEQHLLHENMV